MTMHFANQLLVIINGTYSDMLLILLIHFLFNRRVPQTSSGIMRIEPWIVVESDSSDNEDISVSKDVERQLFWQWIEYQLFSSSGLIVCIYTSKWLLDVDFLFNVKLYRNETPACDELQDVETLLRSHIASNVLFSKTVVSIIRRSKFWKSFMREMMQHKLDDSMDFEVLSFQKFLAVADMRFIIKIQ